MLHKVLYQNRPSPALLELQLSVQPPEFEAVFLENDDSPEMQAKKLAEAEFFLAGHVDEALLARMPTVRMIQTGGVGYENIDVDAVERRGIPVAITPEGTVVGVSEHNMATANRDAVVKKSEAAYANFQRILRGEAPINTVRSYKSVLEEARVGAR